MEELEKKAKAYDDVKEKIALRFGSNVVEEIFSEYEMNEDERIRKAIIDILNEIVVELNYKEFLNISYNIKDMVAWLKKQGEHKSAKNIVESWKDMRLEVYQQASGNRHEPNYSDDTTKMFSLNDIDEIIEKMSEQKSADKVEPKFKVGDWVVNKDGTVHQILSYKNGIYKHTNGYSSKMFEDEWRMWDIAKDAKDGDVLVTVDDEYYRCNNETIAIKDQNNYEYPPINKKHDAWSEEDEVIYAELIKFFEAMLNCLATEERHNENRKWLNWLKSLKERIGWKPSEEQMEALTLAIHDVHEMWYKKHLLSLKQQLKQV